MALEIDITSRTRLNNYEALGVQELWLYTEQKLEINVIESGNYIKSNNSSNFPYFLLVNVIYQYLEQSKIEGRKADIKAPIFL